MEQRINVKEHYEWLGEMANSKTKNEPTYLNVSTFSRELQDFYRSKVNDKNEYVHAFGVILIDFEPLSIFNDKSK